MNIQATATTQGFDLLLHDMEDQVRRYALLGHADLENTVLDALVADDNTTYESIGEYNLLEADIEAAYYDMEGVLTFTLPLPYEANFGKYIYGIALIAEHEGQNIVVSISKTPKIYKITDIGGMFAYKVDIRGETGNVLYTSALPYASAKEAEEGMHMNKVISPGTLAHVLDERMAESINDTRERAVPSAMTVREAIYSAAAPIGMTYFQLAGMVAPADLFGGTWSNISSKFAGRFFRAEGGNAVAFGGSQGDATRNATGRFSFTDDTDLRGHTRVSIADGVFGLGGMDGLVGGLQMWANLPGVHNIVGFNLGNQLPIANEIRPINSTIRIWQRIA